MSILIKSMKMPTSCYACDFAYQDQDSEHNVYWTCAVDHKAANMYERRGDCPLVEIPSHGRLIDADVLKEVSHYDDYDMCVVDVDDIDNAPTVIPTDESDMDSFIHILKEDDEEDGMDSFIRILKD